ncbi:hypothetical protein F511_15278 [Dorcoceras hygrometricum]|uniref:Uncharacterized protein n=1 Tax=Dorcoceras hygrometricum TaxID=472368 RepID=A0A2Z7AE74_9LAMI|nr:hypothetical protein F511_15278 [Dorcoceras hygrometricum]
MKNHEIRPTDSNSFPDVNMTIHDERRNKKKTYFGRNRGRRGRKRRRGHGRFNPYGHGYGKPHDYNVDCSY